jgi:hypothetical protein
MSRGAVSGARAALARASTVMFMASLAWAHVQEKHRELECAQNEVEYWIGRAGGGRQGRGPLVGGLRKGGVRASRLTPWRAGHHAQVLGHSRSQYGCVGRCRARPGGPGGLRIVWLYY